MSRYVITPGIALELAARAAAIKPDTQLVAPTLLRSQVLTLLYQRVRGGELTKRDADAHLDYLRSLKIRLLGDRVLQSVAWRVAAELDWDDTSTAEYIALTQLQADAIVTDDPDILAAAPPLITICPIDDLLA